jgi:hypothetical protein
MHSYDTRGALIDSTNQMDGATVALAYVRTNDGVTPEAKKAKCQLTFYTNGKLGSLSLQLGVLYL